MKSLFAKIGAFLTQFRIWTINLLTLATVVYILVIVVALVRQLPEKVDPEGRVLILAPEGVILDEEVYPERFTFPLSLPENKQLRQRDLVRVIRAAAEDERLAGVLVDFSKTSFSGASTALNIAEELSLLAESGTPVIAFSEVLTTRSYLMAAAADEIYVHPSGSVAISGIGGYRDYMAELAEKLKISVHNYSQGDFKSASESYTRSDMSDNDRRQMQEIYAPIWTALKQTMAAPRELDPALFQAMADDHPDAVFRQAAYDNLRVAQEWGLIDGTLGYPEFRALMIERFGRDEEAERETYPHIGWGAYLAQLEEDEPETEEAVAVVFVQGAIQFGKNAPGAAGADDISTQIRRAYENEHTRALVLRVNSPGGLIMASDRIRDELVEARSRGLPVLVSMGDVAASGGVWVSTPADAIYAEEATITGSIGVVVVVPTIENLLAYIGVRQDGVQTSDFAGWGLSLPVNEKLDAIFARWASSSYEEFVNTVAADRGREPEYIRSIAGGRVWIAGRALELGLVDGIANLEQVIAEAASRASLEEYRVDYAVNEMSPAMALVRRLGLGSQLSLQSPLGAQLNALMREFEHLGQPRAMVTCTGCLLELP